MKVKSFQEAVWAHYRAHGRHGLPWRETHDPYRILVSEVMLQQTQVARVLSKYPEFLARFPTVESLAAAAVKDVLSAWQGLGYNRRALLLKRAAEAVARDYGGKFPQTKAELEALPGIGQSTAGALSAFAFGKGVPFIETNIRAAYIHAFFPGKDGVKDKDLLPVIEESLDRANPREWFYALMDYGVHLKAVNPNPSRKSAHHVRQSAFKGSNRELRAQILRLILEGPRTEKAVIAHFAALGRTETQVRGNLAALEREGFIACKRKRFAIA